MNRTLYSGANDFAIQTRFDPVAAGVAVDFDDPLSARGFLERFLVEPNSLATLRGIAADELSGPPLDDHEVLEVLAWRLFDRSLRIVRLPAVVLAPVGGGPEEVEPAKAPAPVVETTWVEFLVIEEGTDEPFANVKLTITLPDGSKSEHSTNTDGIVALDPVPKGVCKVACNLAGVKRPQALALVTLGGLPPRVPPTGKRSTKNKPAFYKIGRVEHRRVRTGDTLASIAEIAGMTWQELTKFNWGTDDPTEINRRLRWDVGCTKKTADRKNYVFDDSDAPGVILLPMPWLVGTLATGQQHVIRVMPVDVPSWRFSI